MAGDRAGLRDALRANARRMMFSNDTVEAFLEGATLAEVRTVNGVNVNFPHSC